MFASGDSTKHDIYHLEYSINLDNVTAVRIEALPDPRLPNRGPGMTNYEGTIGDFFLTEFQLVARDMQVEFTGAEHSYAKNRYGDKDTSAKTMIDGDIQTGWSVHNGQGQRHVAVLLPARPIPSGKWTLKMHFGRHFSSSLGKFRLSIATDDKPLSANELPPALERLLRLEPTSLTSEQRQVLKNEFLLNAKELAEHSKKIRALYKPLPHQRALVLQQRPVKTRVKPTFITVANFLPPRANPLMAADSMHYIHLKVSSMLTVWDSRSGSSALKTPLPLESLQIGIGKRFLVKALYGHLTTLDSKGNRHLIRNYSIIWPPH